MSSVKSTPKIGVKKEKVMLVVEEPDSPCKDDGKGDSKKEVAVITDGVLQNALMNAGVKAHLARWKAMPRAKGGKSPEYPYTLVFNFSSTSGAAAAQAPVVDVRPGVTSEWAALIQLFDEVICDGGEVHFRSYMTSTTNTNGVDMVMVYDPVIATALTSLNIGLEAFQHKGPLAVAGGPGTTGNLLAQPNAVTPTGFWKMRWKTPRGPSVSNTGGADFSGTWSSTSVTTSTYGHLKMYVEAPSVGTTSITGHFKMFCRFRSRA